MKDVKNVKEIKKPTLPFIFVNMQEQDCLAEMRRENA